MRMNPCRSVAVFAAASLWLAGPSPAQDAHYWTLQYGPRASLLGGAVIGSARDISATYYNPGALSQGADLAFAVSASVLEYSVVRLEDGGGQGVDLGTSKTGLLPSLVAGTISSRLFGGSGILAYSALTRNAGSQDLEGFVLLEAGDLPPDQNLEGFVGSADFTGDFSDIWGGLTYSQAIGDHVGLGLTWYGAVRTQSRKREAVSQFVRTDGTGLSAIDAASGQYTSLRTLFKLGGFYRAGALTAGITVTTPSLRLAGSGQLSGLRSTIGADTAVLLAGVETDLPADYKSPLSVGGGIAWQVGRARLHGSLEWFDSIDPYVVLQGGEVQLRQPPDSSVVLDAVQEQVSVTDWGIAVEYAFASRLTGYLSYYLDASSLDEDIARASLSIIPIDINTLTIGADFVVRSARLTLGFGYGWGSQVDRELTDLLRQQDEDFEATYVYRSTKLLIGFAIGTK